MTPGFRLYFDSCFIQLICIAEQEEADHKHHGNRANCNTGIDYGDTEDSEGHAFGSLADHGNQRGTPKGSTLTADIHEAIVLTALLSGDDLAQVGTAQCLDAALEHTHQAGQDPELPQAHQEHTEGGDTGVADDADLDQQAGVILGGQTAEDNRAGEGHNLGQQQRQQKARGIQTQGGAIGGCHINDGVNTVDEEEEGDQIHKYCFSALIMKKPNNPSLRICAIM